MTARALRAAAASAAIRVVLGLLLPAAAVAQHERVERLEMHWRVNADATSVLERTLEATALSAQGAVSLGKVPVLHNRDLESIEILEALTVKADGRRLPVGAGGIVVQSGLVAQGTGITWPGVEIREVTFPDLVAGDRIVLRWRKASTRAVLPGWASLEDLGTVPGIEYRDVRVRIEAPASLGLAVWVNGLRSTRTTEGTTEVWSVEGSVPARALDPQPADVMLATPRVHASTHWDLRQFAAAFAIGFRERLEVTDEVRELARSIVGDRASDEDKARAIHDWVRANVRYVAVFLGVGGFVPNPLPQVLRNRFGDCKDMALLTVALLRAVGVPAAPALLNTANEYTLPPVPVGINHVIVHLPSLGRFVDPTAVTVPFGALPFADADKPVAVALDDGPVILRTPPFAASGDGANAYLVRSHWRIDRDGNARATLDVEASGQAATLLQDRLVALGARGSGAAAARQVLAAARLEGGGTLSHPPVRRDRQHQTLRIEFAEVRHLLADADAGSLAVHPSTALPLLTLHLLPTPVDATRRMSTTCTPVRVREEFVLEFDPAYRILRVPPPLRETGPDGIAFEAAYSVEGSRVVGRRELAMDHGRHLCTPEHYVERRPSIQRIVRHLRAVVLYEQAPVRE